jgi:hypothetical protein
VLKTTAYSHGRPSPIFMFVSGFVFVTVEFASNQGTTRTRGIRYENKTKNKTARRQFDATL